MAPRKSTSSTTAPGDTNGDVSMVSNASTTHAHPAAAAAASHSKPSRQSGGHRQQDDGVSIDDLLLPRSLVSRLARGVLPANTSIQKDATLALAKSATVFISYLAHHANEQTNKKTISPQDVMKALEQIEMAGVMELGAVGHDGRLGGRLERELEAYEEHIRGKRKGYRDKVKARESGAGGAADEEGQAAAAAARTDDAEVEPAERGEPSNKKARRMSEADDNKDDDERMLEAQLNGSNAAEANGRGEVENDDQDEVEDDADEDEEEVEEEEDDEVEEENDDEEDQDEDDEEGEDDADELEGRHDRRNNADTRRVGLMPDGNVDMSGEESD